MTPQSKALGIAGAIKHGLVICPAMLQREWDTLLRATFPNTRPYVVNPSGSKGVDLTATWIVASYETAEYAPGVHKALLAGKYDVLIIDREPACPELMTRTKKTIYIPDRIGADRPIVFRQLLKERRRGVMSEVQPIIPPRVKKLIEQFDREAARKRDKAAAKFIKLLSQGKNDAAVQALMAAADRGEDAGLGITGQKHLMDAELRAMVKRGVDRSPEAIDKRQRRLVEILTSGQRCSLTRAWKMAGYSRHHPALDQILTSPAILTLFQDAVDAGRKLPPKFAARILEALEDRELGLR